MIGSDHDKLDTNGELIFRKKLFFKVASKNLHSVIDELKTQKEVTSYLNEKSFLELKLYIYMQKSFLGHLFECLYFLIPAVQ